MVEGDERFYAEIVDAINDIYGRHEDMRAFHAKGTPCAGRLEVTELAFDREQEGDVLVFDPTRVTDGIELSDDLILLARPHAYAESVLRRTGVARQPDPVG